MRRRTPPAALVAVFLLAAGILSGPAASADPSGPNLAVSQTAGPDPVLVGSNTTYTVTVSNVFVSTAADATNVDVTDTLPSNANFVSATTSPGTCDAPASGQVVCHLGTISDSTSQSIDVVVTPTSPGTVTNVATVTSDQTPDPTPADDTSSKDVQAVNPQADLHVTQTDAPDPVLQGAQETYTVTITNQPVVPPSDATGTTLTDTLPSGSTFVSAVPSVGSCDPPASGQVVCDVGTLASSASATVTVKVTAGTGSSMSNTAAASSDLPDPDNSDDSSTESTTINAPSADLSVSQVDAPDPVKVGHAVQYTVTVHNGGPQTATGVSLADTLPSPATFGSAVPSQGSCPVSPTAGVETCSLASLVSGASATVVVTVTPTSTGTATNVADVSGTESDPSSGNNHSSESTTVNPLSVDLSVAQSDSPDPVKIGHQVTYTMTVHNGGPDPATGVSLVDLLPTGATFNSIVGSQGTCGVPSGGSVTCSLGSLASGSDATVTLKVTPTSAPETLTNDATVSGAQADPAAGNNHSVESTTVTPLQSDLRVTQVDKPDPVKIGHQVAYTITVRNAGPDTATGVSLNDQLPGGATFNSATPTQGSCGVPSGGVLTCSLGTLASGAKTKVVVKVTPTHAPATISNQASISGDQVDPVPANNSDTETTTVNELQADLAVTQTDAPDPVKVGQQITYTVHVTNNGPDAANHATLTDDFPANVTFGSATTTQDSCAAPSGGVVTCSLGTMAPSGTATITVKVTPNTDGSAVNDASASADETDPVPGNNDDTETTTVNPLQTDIAVSQTDSPDPVKVGQQVTYTVNVTNNGPDGATGVSLVDTLPTGTTFNSAVPSKGSCGAPSGGQVTCSIGTLASGASATVKVKVTPSGPGTITNKGVASANEPDPNAANNTDNENTTVNPLHADLSVTQTDSPDPARVGQQITYTVVVTNNGPDGTGGVSLADTLPGGTSFDSATTTKGSCGAPSGGSLTCPIGTLASGAGATITIKVTATATGTPSNQATVSGTEDDPVSGNNHDSETTTINPTAADVRVTQADAPDPVKVGQQVTYTVSVTNNGPDGATGVSLVDTLPTGTTFNSAVPSKGSCGAPSGGQVTCSIGALASGASATVTVKVTTNSTGTITNKGVASANESDPNPANNTNNENTTVTALQTDLRVTQTDSPDPAKPGQQVTYTVVATNLGPDDATGVSLADDYPTGVTFNSATTTKGSCGAPSGGVVTCSIGSLASGANATVTVKVTPSASGTLTNQVSVSGAEPDPVSANNSSSIQTTVNDLQADLRVTQTDSPDPVTAGQNVAYTVSVHNNGPDPATLSQAQDTLPSGTVFAGASSTAGSCGSPSGGQVTCSLGTIASGGDVTVTITVSVTTAGSVTNTQDVSASETDATPANNHDTESTTVNGPSCTKIGTNGNDNLPGTGGDDVMCGLGGDDTLNGGAGDDRLIGGPGNDTLNGGDGDDQAFGNAGNDDINGAAGSDFVRFDLSSAPVTVSLAAGTATGEGNDQLTGFEGVIGSPNADHIIGDSNSNSIYGRGGNDDLVGGGGFDYVRYDLASAGVSVDLSAGSSGGADGHDSLTGFEGIVGSPFADSLHGDANDNTITGRGGADEIVGGQGFDYVSYNLSPAAVTVNLPNDTAFGGEGSDTLSGIEGMIGSSFKDTFTGTPGENAAYGGDGNDTLKGNDGNDSLYGEGGDDDLAGGPGNDYLDGGAGVDKMDGGGGQDTCIGPAADKKVDCESSSVATTRVVLPQALPPD